MMKLTPVLRTTLGEQVAEQLAGMISAGKWNPGDKLPSELELRKTLHIGRSTLREALRSLSYVGLVIIKPGDGTYVRQNSAKPLKEVLTQGKLRTQAEVDDLFEARFVLEMELASLCAQRASETDLQAMEALALEMEKSKDEPSVDFASLDIQFHLAMAEGAKNRILGRLYHAIHGLIREIMTKREYIIGGHDETCHGHRKILQALKLKKVREARLAMREHLDGFSAKYLREHLTGSRPKNDARAADQGSPPPKPESSPATTDTSADPALSSEGAP